MGRHLLSSREGCEQPVAHTPCLLSLIHTSALPAGLLPPWSGIEVHVWVCDWFQWMEVHVWVCNWV